MATQQRTSRRDRTSWLDEVAQRRTEQILADDRQQQAIARHIADALQILGRSEPRLARLVAGRIERGHAAAIPEWTDGADPLSLRYRIEVDMGTGDPLVLVRAPWTAWGVTLDQVNAEHAAREV